MAFPTNLHDTVTMSEVREERLTRFNKLSTELRVRIWRLSFPSRTYFSVSLGRLTVEPNRMFKNGQLCNPKTLRINQESRYETLRYYRLLLSSNKTSVYFNPTTDIVCFEDHETMYTTPFSSVKHINWFQRAGGHVESIKHLTFVMVHWNDDARDDFLVKPTLSLCYFKRLEKLNLVFDACYHDMRCEHTVVALQECKAVVGQYFEKRRENSPATKIPEIVCLVPSFRGTKTVW
jgi:hypothetical protein